MYVKLQKFIIRMSKLVIYASILCYSFTMAFADGSEAQRKPLDEIAFKYKSGKIWLVDLLTDLETVTNFRFAYVENEVKNKSITLSGNTRNLGDLLREVSMQSRLSFKRVNETITVKGVKSENPLPSVEEEIHIQWPISGVVYDETGEPLPGATVMELSTTNGTITNAQGKFEFSVASESSVLAVSFVGYRSQEIPVSGRSVININMEVDITTIEEVVVVGYGTQERKEVTGAVVSIKGEQISRLPVANVGDALQGQAAGVDITSSSGAPGQDVNIRIRGVNTINDTDPLIVIDGVPFVSGGLNAVNPNDIASVEVLKDASASAIYGARAANGVILITTKRGKKGETKVSLNTFTGVQNPWRTLDLLDRDQYLGLNRVINENVGEDSPDAVLNPRPGVNTDWQDEIFESALMHQTDLSISGGNEHATYALSGNYFNQDGIILGTNFERYTVRINSDYEKGRFRIGESIFLSRGERDPLAFGSRSTLEHTIKQTPLVPVRDPNNLGGFAGPSGADGQDARNPVGINELYERTLITNAININVFGEVMIIPGLKYKLNLGYGYQLSDREVFTPTFQMGGLDVLDQNIVSNRVSQNYSTLIENLLTYQKNFGKHDMTLLAGYSEQTDRARTLSGSGEATVSNEVQQLQAVTDQVVVNGNLNEAAIRSIFGRVNYSYNDRYLLTFNIRRDASSRFRNPNYGVFPSFSVGWRLSEESFMQSLRPVLSEAKLRGGYGVLGNDRIGNYAFSQDITLGADYAFNGQKVEGAAVAFFTYPNLSWESVRQTNIGADLSFFSGRLQTSIDYFYKRTEDMLLRVPLPVSSGGGHRPPFRNAGEIENRGFEVQLNYRTIVSEDLDFNIGANFSTFSNEVLSLGPDPENFIAAGSAESEWGGTLTQTEVGGTIGAYYGFVTDGIYQNQQEIDAMNRQVDGEGNPIPFAPDAVPGDIRFRDIDGDGLLTDDDRAFIGDPIPDFIFGLSGGVNFKAFDFSFLIQGVQGNDLINNNKFWLEGMHTNFNQGASALNHWTEDNRNTNIPRPALGDPNGNVRRFSDRFIEDGSYLRCRNITLGWSVPAKFLQKHAIDRLRIYVMAQNLFTITDYSGFDPEIEGIAEGSTGGQGNLVRGIDNGVFPKARTFIGGLQITF